MFFYKTFVGSITFKLTSVPLDDASNSLPVLEVSTSYSTTSNASSYEESLESLQKSEKKQ